MCQPLYVRMFLLIITRTLRGAISILQTRIPSIRKSSNLAKVTHVLSG